MKFINQYKHNASATVFTFLILFTLFLISCQDDGIIIDESLLTKYNSYANKNVGTKAIEDIDCYLDYSNGMPAKIQNIPSFTEMLVNLFQGKSVNYYIVGNADTLISTSKEAVDFRNTTNYKDQVSKLDVAIKKMALNKNRTSVFITDFEKIEGGKTISNPQAPTPFLKLVDNTAWAQNSFREWIKSGNQIDIFAMSFNDKGIDNNIYTIVFTPDSIIKNEDAYKNSVLKFLTEHKEGDTKQFTYTDNNFKIEQEKKDDAIGDANDNLIVQEPPITNTLKNRFEYYHFKSSDLVGLNTDESQEDKRIINKLKITSKLSGLTDVQFDLKVYDVTASLTELYNSLNQEAPEVKTNAETGVDDTIANKPSAFKYKHGKEVKDIFEFIYNKKGNETGIKVKPDFTGVSENSIYQIDIIVKSVKLKDFSDENNFLKLNYPNVSPIYPLSKSIEYAMRDVAINIPNKVIYTVYIKIDK